MKQKMGMWALSVIFAAASLAHADSLPQQMVSANDAVRESAFQQLGSLSEADRKSIVTGLVKFLNDTDFDRRERALEAISKMGPAAAPAIPALRKSLGDDLPYIRTQAAEALANIGPAALPVLLEELHNENNDLREIAARAIGKLDPAKSQSAIPMLVNALSDSDSAVRQRTESDLERLGPDIVPPLLEAIDTAHGDTKFAIIRLLGAVNSTDPAVTQKLVSLISSDNKQMHFTVVKALDRKGSAAVPALIEALKSDDASVKIGACEVLADLGRKGAAAVPALVNTLKDPQAEVRAEAAVALGKMGSEAAAQAVPALQEAKKDSDPRVAAKAADALTNLTDTIQKKKDPSLFADEGGMNAAVSVSKTTAPASPTHKAVVQKPKVKTRPAAAKVPAGKSVKSPAALVKQLENADEVKRATAAQTLIQLGIKAIPALLHAMDSANPIVRASVCSILGDITPPVTTAVPALSKALQDAAPEVRQNAAEAVIKIDKVAAVPVLVEAAKSADVTISTPSISMLGQLGADAKDAVPALTDLTKSANPDVRGEAAAALDKIGTPEAKKAVDAYTKQQTLKAVAAALKDLRKDSKTVSMPAVDALVKLGAPAVPQVSIALKDPNPVIRQGAAKVLNRLGKDSASAVPTLIEALDDSDATVRHESASALEKIGTPAATKPLGTYRLKEKFRDLLHTVHLG